MRLAGIYQFMPSLGGCPRMAISPISASGSSRRAGLEILQCIPVVIIYAFLDLEKKPSFSDSLLDPTSNPSSFNCSPVSSSVQERIRGMEPDGGRTLQSKLNAWVSDVRIAGRITGSDHETVIFNLPRYSSPITEGS